MATMTPAARAGSYQYTYIGNTYTTVTPANGCYTTAQHLTITVVLPHRLPPNQFTAAAPKSFTVNDGVITWRGRPPVNGDTFYFNTDANGEIYNWQVSVQKLAMSGDVIYTDGTFNAGDSGTTDMVRNNRCRPHATASNNYDQGSWAGP